MKNSKLFGKGLTIGLVLLMVISVFGFFGGAHSATVYSLTWEEKNLPSGTTWGVVIWNETSHTGTTLTNTTYTVGGHVYGNITFSAESGVTYLYNYTGTPWFFNSTKNNVSVSATETYTVNFIENFTLNVTESGFTTTPPTGFAYSGTLETTTWGFDVGTTSYSTNKTYNNIKLAQGSISLKFSNIIQTIAYKQTTSGGLSTTIDYPGLAFVPSLSYDNLTLSSNSTVHVNWTELIPFQAPMGSSYISSNVYYKFTSPLSFSISYTSGGTATVNNVYYYVPVNSTLYVNETVKTPLETMLWFDHPKGAQIADTVTSFNNTTALPPATYTISNSTNWQYQNISVKVSFPMSLSNLFSSSGYNPFTVIFTSLIAEFSSSSANGTANIRNYLAGVWNPVAFANSSLFTSAHWNVTGYETNNPNPVTRSGTGFFMNLSGINDIYNATADVYGIWGNLPIVVHGMAPWKGSFNHTTWYLKGYAPINVYFTSPAKVSVINGSYTSYTWNSTGNGYYDVEMHGFAFLLINEAGKMPLVFFLHPKNQWLNITQSMFQNNTNSVSVNISQIMRSTPTEELVNVSNIPAGFSYLSGSYVLTGIHKIGDLWQEVYLYLYHSSGFNPNVLNISLIKDIEYRIQLITNTSQNMTMNVTSTTGYYTLNLGNYNIDPVLNVSAYPVAVISGAPSAIPLDTAVVFHGGNSYYNITNYTWTINGPEKFIEYGPNPSVFFSLSGIYTVSLTVTSVDGLTNTTTTTLTVVTSQVDNNIVMSVVKSQFTNGTWELKITVDAKDNVSISQITVQVGSSYVNVSLSSQVGFEYTYISYLNPAKFAYGNYTIKIMAFNSLDEYNSLTTYLTFGSVNGIGLLGYITTNTLLLVVVAFLIIAIIIFVYSMANEPRRNTKIKVNTKRRKK